MYLVSVAKSGANVMGKKDTVSQLKKEISFLRKRLKQYENTNAKLRTISVKNSHNNFYRSRPWKEVRYKALLKHKCRVGSVCSACGQTTSKLHVDHIQPRSKRPDLELDMNNLQVLCADCNFGKSNVDSTDWSKITDKPKKEEDIKWE